MRKLDLTAQRFGLLTAIGKSTTRQNHWVCECECGVLREMHTRNLRSGNTRGCGCVKPGKLKHGQSNSSRRNGKPTRTYQIWLHIKARCERPTAPDYHLYGGRGISVCEQWQAFENFYADMGEAPAGMSIDRIDNQGDYTPANCRWATPQIQANNRRSNRIIIYQGQQFTLADLARLSGLKYSTLSMRLRWGWSMDRALSPTK